MNPKRIIHISRPRFWIYEAGPYLLGIAGALPVLSLTDIDPRIIIFFIYFLIPANILIYGINDIFDYETDKLNPKKVAYESLVMPQEHKSVWLYVIATTVPFIFALNPKNIPSIIFFAIFIFCATFYSAWPIRAKIRPILDMIFSGSHYVATGGFAYALVTGNTPPIFALIAGLVWAMAMHAYSAVPDIDADKNSGLHTVATFLHRTPTLWMCTIFYITSSIIASLYIGISAFVLLIPYLYLMIKSIRTDDEKLFRLYTYFPKLNALVGMIIFFYIALKGL